MRRCLPILLLLLCAASPAHAQSDLLFASGFETGNATIGPSGGVVPGPDGVRLLVAEGALEDATDFRIAVDAVGAPPVPAGIDLAGPIYAITPHGTGFDATAVVELPVPPGGGPVFLLKGEPGADRWQVVVQSGAPGPVLRSGLESLSFFAIGRCNVGLPADACPAGHSLSLELFDASSVPLPLDPDNPLPVVLLTEPTLLTLRLRWNRPPLTIRTDTVSAGSQVAGGALIRTAGFAFGPGAPDGESTPGNFDRTFGVTVTPTQVPGSANLERFGVVRNLWGQAKYTASGFAQGWDFLAFVPIRIYDPAGATAPFEITSQPTDQIAAVGQPATFSVATTMPPGSALTYQWFRANGPTAPFQPVANGSNASYTLPSVGVADDGARFRVQVCSTRPQRCLTSSTARLVLGGPAAPVFAFQPQDASVPLWRPARFDVGVSVANTLELSWERSNDSGANWTVVGPGTVFPDGGLLEFSTVASDDGALFRVEACNVIGAQRTCVYSNSASLEVRTVWTAPEVVLDWRTGLDLPQAEPLNSGAVVNDNGTLRLLGITAPGVPAVLATGVFGRPRVANLGGIYQWVLFQDRTAGSSCGASSGNRLNAIGLFVDVEGVVAAASPRFVVSDGPDCILDTAAAATAGGVALAVRRQSSGTPRGVRFTQQYNRLTQTWSVAQVEDVALSASAPCNNTFGLAERGLAAPSRGILPAPARAAVLAYESVDGGGQSWTCAATLSTAGIWSAVAPVRSNGTITPSTANILVAMDPQGNAVLVGNAASAGGARALRLARLPVASTTWVEERSYALTQDALPDLAADPDDGSVLMAWRDAPAAGAGFTTVFVAGRAMDGAWSEPLRVLDDDIDTRFPRVTMAPGGEALVTFQALDAGRFRVIGARRRGGVFDPPGWLQAPGSPEGRFAVSARYWFVGSSIDRLEGLPIYWRETDPADATRTRIVRARVLLRP